MNPTTSVESVNLADEIARQTREAERCLVAQAFLNPIGGWNAAVKVKLSGEDFAFPEHSALFRYCLLAAQRGFDPTSKQCVELLAAVGIALTESDVEELALETQTHHSQIELYARQVAYYARKRRQAKRLQKRLTEVFASDVVERIVARCRTANTQSSETSRTLISSRSNGSGRTGYRKANSALLPVRKASVSR